MDVMYLTNSSEAGSISQAKLAVSKLAASCQCFSSSICQTVCMKMTHSMTRQAGLYVLFSNRQALC